MSKHESTYRLLLLFMSTGDKETLGTLLSHFPSLHPELPVYWDVFLVAVIHSTVKKIVVGLRFKSRMKLSSVTS